MTVTILIGDVRDRLRDLPADSFDCVVTSPPYWGLRDYGVAGQLGLEPTMLEHIAVMVDVFAEVHRVLKPTGTLWLNYGDCYATSPNGRRAADTKALGVDDRTFRDKPFSTIGGVLKAKDLAMIPNRLAIALQQPFYQGEIKDEMDRVWLAAMIDAEGSIYIHRQPEGTKTGRDSHRTQDNFCVGIALSNCHESIVRKAAAICGRDNVHCVAAAGGHRRDHYHWRVTGNVAKTILTEIYPYLVGKSREARIAIACPPSGDLAAATWAALKDLHKGRSTGLDARAPDVSALWRQGWWVRSEIIWGKPNPMPESIRDRPATSHEKIFMLTKSARYFYAADEVRQGATSDRQDMATKGLRTGLAYLNGNTDNSVRPSKQQAIADAAAAVGGSSGRRMGGFNERWDAKERTAHDPVHEGHINHTGLDSTPSGSRSLRNWEPAPLQTWIMGTSPFSEAHFATFPPELVERCLKAGCPKDGKVLDIFGGAGTTALVADQMQLNCTIIELNPDYVHIAGRRIEADRGAIQNSLDPLMFDFGEQADA